ncbi:MAG TPA: hypothetical protein VK249_01205 [Anaerolineales bacterium]|nr:hypothetical protein [Anaerolineales bacterium]
MNDILKLPIELTEKRRLVLILTQDKARNNKTDLIANLILNGPLFIVSGDEWLPSYLLPRLIRERTTEIKTILECLHTVRASTCYRLWDSLASIPSKGEPILVMDFLHTFYDADIPLRTRLFRLRECCRELKRLAFYRPVIVMTQELEGEDYEKFSPALFPIADKTFILEPELEQISQPVLF